MTTGLQGRGEDQLAGEELARVWVPGLVFRNSRDRDLTIPADPAVSLTIIRNGSAQQAGLGV